MTAMCFQHYSLKEIHQTAVSAPFSFLFLCENEKNCADKKSVCKWREETCQTFFSPAGEIL